MTLAIRPDMTAAQRAGVYVARLEAAAKAAPLTADQQTSLTRYREVASRPSAPLATPAAPAVVTGGAAGTPTPVSAAPPTGTAPLPARIETIGPISRIPGTTDAEWAASQAANMGLADWYVYQASQGVGIGPTSYYGATADPAKAAEQRAAYDAAIRRLGAGERYAPTPGYLAEPGLGSRYVGIGSEATNPEQAAAAGQYAARLVGPPIVTGTVGGESIRTALLDTTYTPFGAGPDLAGPAVGIAAPAPVEDAGSGTPRGLSGPDGGVGIIDLALLGLAVVATFGLARKRRRK